MKFEFLVQKNPTLKESDFNKRNVVILLAKRPILLYLQLL